MTFRIVTLAALSVGSLPFISGMEKVTDMPETNESSITVHSCSGCFKHEVGVRFKLCQGCKQNRYCSQACQKVDWPRHQEDCKKIKPLKEELSAIDALLEKDEALEIDSDGPINTSHTLGPREIKGLTQKIEGLTRQLDGYRKRCLKTSKREDCH